MYSYPSADSAAAAAAGGLSSSSVTSFFLLFHQVSVKELSTAWSLYRSTMTSSLPVRDNKLNFKFTHTTATNHHKTISSPWVHIRTLHKWTQLATDKPNNRAWNVASLHETHTDSIIVQWYQSCSFTGAVAGVCFRCCIRAMLSWNGNFYLD